MKSLKHFEDWIENCFNYICNKKAVTSFSLNPCFTQRSIDLHIHHSIYTSIILFTHPSFYLHIHHSIYTSITLFTHPSFYLHVCHLLYPRKMLLHITLVLRFKYLITIYCFHIPYLLIFCANLLCALYIRMIFF